MHLSFKFWNCLTNYSQKSLNKILIRDNRMILHDRDLKWGFLFLFVQSQSRKDYKVVNTTFPG